MPHWLPALVALAVTACSIPEGRKAGDCTDDADNDGDGLFDCNDDGCAGAGACGGDEGGPGGDDTDLTGGDTDGGGDDTGADDTSGEEGGGEEGGGGDDTAALTDLDEDGYDAPEDCDDTDPDVHPDADERCDDIDNDCDGELDEDPVDGSTYYTDGDGDGYGEDGPATVACEAETGLSDEAGDCDDADPDVHPDAEEIPGDGTDDDCDGVDNIDADGDGYYAAEWGGDDCDDSAADTYPDATDTVGDGVDEDCDGIDGVDADDDGYASEASGGDDCDDTDPDASPGGTDDWLDGVDGDCDGTVDNLEDTDLTTVFSAAGTYARYSWFVGDVDADGDEDMVTDSASHDYAYLVHGPVTGAVTLSAGWELTYITAQTAARGADVDRDGDDDLVLAYDYSNHLGVSRVGEVWIFEGPVRGYPEEGDEDVVLYGDTAYGYFGSKIANLGDVTGDVFDDLGVASAGEAYVYSRPPSDGDPSDADVTVIQEGTERDSDLAGADLDGDGVNDLLVGDPGADGGATVTGGAVYVFLGDVDGTLVGSDADMVIQGPAAYEGLGYRIATPSDFDDDGYLDLALGTALYGPGYVWMGPPTVGSVDGDRDATLGGVTSADCALAPCEVYVAGDLDGDGIPDVLVGDPTADGSGTDNGMLYAVLAPYSGTVDLSAADGTIAGTVSKAGFGKAMSSADADGDGAQDLLIASAGGSSVSSKLYLLALGY